MSSILSQVQAFLASDPIFFVVVFVIFGAATLYFGRGWMVSFILSFFPASILYTAFPFLEKLLVLKGDNLLPLNKLVIFLLFLVPICIIVKKFIYAESIDSGSMHFLRTGIFALIGLVLVVMLSYSTVNYDAYHNFSPTIDTLFTPVTRIFYWNIGIFGLLAFL